MGAPQIVMIVLFSLKVVLGLLLHKVPHQGENNAFINLASVVFYAALLYWGGFW